MEQVSPLAIFKKPLVSVSDPRVVPAITSGLSDVEAWFARWGSFETIAACEFSDVEGMLSQLAGYEGWQPNGMQANIDKKVIAVSPTLEVDQLIKPVFLLPERISLFSIAILGKGVLHFTYQRFHVIAFLPYKRSRLL